MVTIVCTRRFATGSHADGFRVTDSLFGQCESQPGSIESRRFCGYEPGLSPDGDELADKLSRGCSQSGMIGVKRCARHTRSFHSR